MRFLPCALCLVVVMGCEGKRVDLVTSIGFHAPPRQLPSKNPGEPPKPGRFIVWASHPAVSNSIIAVLQRDHQIVLERARLQQVLDEQQVRLTHSSDDDADILRVGKLLGADRVIFAEHTISSKELSTAMVYQGMGGGRRETLQFVSVAVRAVDVETGEIRWSGTAQSIHAVPNPEPALTDLAMVAMARAVCPVEAGAVWVEPYAIDGKLGDVGCKRPDQTQSIRASPTE